MTGVRGKSVTLRCPIDSSDDNMMRRIKDWFKEDTRESIARLITRNSNIRHTVTSSEDMLISYPEGDLTIQNLRHEDAGVYICHFTGSVQKKIRLLVTGRLILYLLNGFMADWLIKTDRQTKITDGWSLSQQSVLANVYNSCHVQVPLIDKNIRIDYILCRSVKIEHYGNRDSKFPYTHRRKL